MKYTLKTSRVGGYHEDDMPRLEGLGFKLFRDGTASIRRTNVFIDRMHYPVVEINTIEELDELRKKVGHPLIVYESVIEIYDDYRE